jgi:hypothetical protein
MDYILNPMYYATIDSGESKNSKSIIEISDWAKEKGTELLIVRRLDSEGSIRIQPTFIYEYINGRQIRVW